MTLLLTCVTDRFTVQASDRRLTNLEGGLQEELANKATLLCNFASFAYTGLTRISRFQQTDQLLMNSLAKPGSRIFALIENLREQATKDIRDLPLPDLRPSERLVARRTSFVGCGFIGMRNPASYGCVPTRDELHPFIAVVSNAQDLSEAWRPTADREFSSHIELIEPDVPFRLHVAGQRLSPDERKELSREITRCLSRVEHPEPIARLLVRAIRRVSSRNQKVGPNVMCTFVRRADVGTPLSSIPSGPVPLIPEVQNEASYFRRMQDSHPTKYVFSPEDPANRGHFGPNVACEGMMMTGMLMGPPSFVEQFSSEGPPPFRPL